MKDHFLRSHHRYAIIWVKEKKDVKKILLYYSPDYTCQYGLIFNSQFNLKYLQNNVSPATVLTDSHIQQWAALRSFEKKKLFHAMGIEKSCPTVCITVSTMGEVINMKNLGFFSLHYSLSLSVRLVSIK